MKIEQGKFYRTRGGYKVRIYSASEENVWYVHGAILRKSGWCISWWDTEGRNGESEFFNIVSEWVDEITEPGVYLTRSGELEACVYTTNGKDVDFPLVGEARYPKSSKTCAAKWSKDGVGAPGSLMLDVARGKIRDL